MPQPTIWVHFVCVTFVITALTNAQHSTNEEELLNWCLDAQSHKSRPGKEEILYEECKPWKNWSCCTHNTTYLLHETNIYNLTLDACADLDERYEMSDECRKHFMRDFCFYECEPSVGPWVVKVDRKIAKERFYQVPLCASDCEEWFKACQKDYACAKNWPREFKWKNGKNSCPPGAECRRFEEIYTNATDFCENVWDHSWKVEPDEAPCMKIWFDPSNGNPNKEVARIHAKGLSKRMYISAAGTDVASVVGVPLKMVLLCFILACLF